MTRDEAIALLNDLANEPANLAALGYEWVDLSGFFDRPTNLAIGDENGVGLFAEREPGVYEGHYLFKVRGPDALRHARNIIDQLFTLHEASAIVGEVPESNQAARHLTRALGFTPVGASVNSEGRSCVTYILERSKWAESSAESSVASATS